MKFLHTSDLHLNSKMASRLDKERAKERKRELLLNFKKMTDIAEAESCSAFIIAGDLFDSEKISESVRSDTLDIIASKSNISFLYLPGNHERDAISFAPALPENLLIFGKDWTYFEIGDVCFAGIAETEPGMFYKLKSASEGKKLIVVLHGEIRDKSESGGAIGLSEMKNCGIDYLALGHYHSFKEYEIEKGKYAVYSGTPLGRGFDETGDCGFVIGDTDGDFISYTFKKSEGRRLSIIDVSIDDVSGTHELLEKISEATKKISATELLRVRLVGGRNPEEKFDLEFIKERLNEGFYYLEIKDESHLKISKDDYLNSKSLKGEFIRLVLSDEALSEQEREDIIAMGISALMGENV